MTVRPDPESGSESEPDQEKYLDLGTSRPETPLPRLKLPGVSGPSDAAPDEGGKPKRRGGADPGLRAKDRRGGAARDQRKFVPRRGGG